ncbi:LCP family protein [Mycobacterium sp. Y57]|uniref:LCP family protein n=1 Tax=Mycolicibacterium xanthum TaxID=2796469 RepID=UPI001C84E2C2|nr:LCP family protein [Mycolicibacterium xanthum]MBX7432339.1 LCP family protein [Mycolicibacterium xanthum]
MSDGDHVTPGRPHSADGSADGDWHTRPESPAPGDTPVDAGPTAPVTVADLIAKIAAEAPSAPPTRHRARSDVQPDPGPDARPDAGPEPDAEPYPVSDDLDTTVLPIAAALLSELPDLTAPPAVPQPRPAAPRPRPRHRRAALAGRAAAALLAVLALALTGGAWQWQASKNSMLNRVAALDPDSRDIVDPNAQFGDENFLIVGVDSRFGENLDMGAGDTEAVAGSRSDTVMLVNVPANRDRVVAVSFPRDLEIAPMKCEPWDPQSTEYGPIYDEETGTYGPDEVYTEYKLNSAFAVGGPKCLVKVIQKLSGLHVNRFMAVDFAGFSKMVDALGGIEVCSTEPIEDSMLGTVLARPGRQIVDGHTALNYVRARYVTTETNGDYGRIKRQQLFLSSLMRSLISKDTFFSLSKLNNVVNMFIEDSYVDNMDTKDLVELGQSIQGVAAGRITFVTVPTVGYADEWGNEVPRTDDMKALFNAIIDDDPLPEERNADDTPVAGTPEALANATTGTGQDGDEVVDTIVGDPGDITVQVSNSTSEAGLATDAADALQAHGFNITTPDDYPGPLSQTTVFYSPGNEEAAATVASAFADPAVERVTGMGDVVQVVLGNDFDAVSAPSPSGSSVQIHVIRGTKTTPTTLPEDLTVTNAADTTCE